MAIRPIDVRRKEFKSGFRGYDANQVDDFLDAVADEFERTYAENRRIAEELTVLKGRLEQFEELEGAIREALVHAQQVARDLRRNANKEAELTVREAKEQAHRILADSSARVERVQESYEALRKAKQDFNNDFRHLLKTYAAVMENTDIASAKEIEASLRERLDTESIAVARQAAETQQMEAAKVEEVEAAAQDAQDAPEPQREAALDDATQRIEAPPTTPEPETPGETSGRDISNADAPEAKPQTESREEPGDVQDTQGREETSRRETPFAPAEDSGASDEADREEPTPAGEGRTSDDFFDKDREDQPEDQEEEGRIFRASRFLRRRA
jgi:cell division initiation protein